MNKKYQIIYADPPWEYADPKGHNPAMGGITYQTMPLQAIKDIPVKDIADTDCSLFLWVTMPMLKEGLVVIEAWGFRYITCAFTWVKQNKTGMGIYSGLGHHLYRWLKKETYPEGYQTLCMNCQALKKHENKEYGNYLRR